MKACAYCGRENPDAAAQCHECGTTEFLSSNVPAVPPEHVAAEDPAELEPQPSAPERDLSVEAEVLLCTGCLAPNSPDGTWCEKCGAPISFAAVVGPVDAARASGFMWRGAVRGRPSTFVLVSCWLLFFPGLISNLFTALSILVYEGEGPLAGVLVVWPLAAAAAGFSMLYQVTRNRLTLAPVQWNETER